MKIEDEVFGTLKSGKEIRLFKIENQDGSKAEFTNFGATVVCVQVSDKDGNNENVVLGFDDINKYEDIRAFYGATVGRCGNRIANGKFSLNGEDYLLNTNEGSNHLHGGIKGFDRVVWDYKILDDESAIKFSYLSKDGEEGYPGNFRVSVTYSFNEKHELKIQYEMTSDKATVKNVTNHSYFNLSGNVKRSILEQQITITADRFLPINKNLIPTGDIRPVENTPMDFRELTDIGKRINEDNEQLKFGLGYDHCWVLNESKQSMNFAAEVYDPKSGRLMEILTTEPAIQFYSGNFMDGSHAGREGVSYKYRYAMCLETQHYPDSPNHADFPSTVLDSGQVYNSQTIYKFSIK